MNMHEYSLNSQKRLESIVFIAVISAYLALIISPMIDSLNQSNVFVGYFISTSPFVIFAIIFYAFDNFLWRIKPFSQLLNVPDFNGVWKGEGNSTYNRSQPQKFTVKITINQTFSKIMVDSQFYHSYSESFSAMIDGFNQSRKKLVYSYTNKPEATAKGIQEHIGTVEVYMKNQNALQGNYFTNRKPLTSGTFNLTRVEK